ncbi:MAG: hypothetical protein LUF91_06265 [Oscillospiraceae bacterium]|nr:hypothetical protein [Oscillospiraceae bacterium]
MICGITIAIARFLAGIQTEASKFVDSIDNLNDMEDAAFSKLFNLLCVGFDAQMMQSARKVADCRIRQHLPDDILTIREEIILDLYSMRKTVNE